LREREILLGKLLVSFLKTARRANTMVLNDVSLFYQFEEDHILGSDMLDEG